MSKTDTPIDRRPPTPLADSELDAVSGGFWNVGGIFARSTYSGGIGGGSGDVAQTGKVNVN